MLQSVLAVLLFGMVPVSGGSVVGSVDSDFLSVLPPSPLIESLPKAMEKERLTASGFTIMDLETSQTLYAHNANSRRPVASLTKLMTAVVIYEKRPLGEWVTIPNGVNAIVDSKVVLTPGQHYQVGQLLTAMLVSSSNDAAYALAVHHSGTEEAFAAEMNERALTLGLKDTHFTNSMGFDDAQHWSTAQDIAHLASFALHYPELKSRLSLPQSEVRSREGTTIALEQTHLLLNGSSPVIAGKTGTTVAAGQCLMSVVREKDRDYLVVLLSSRERYQDMRLVLNVLAHLLA